MMCAERKAMETFTDIYRILHGLESCMDLGAVNLDMISPETLKISKERWENIWRCCRTKATSKV